MTQGDLSARYLASCLPSGARAAGLALHPFTLGHAHLLSAATPWRPLDEPLLIGDLAPALFVCSRPWQAAARGMHRKQFWFALRLSWRLRSAGQVMRAFRDLCEWLARSTSCPELRVKKPQGNGAPRRPAGSPLLLRLRLFATRELHASDPFDLLFSELLWLMTSAWEEEGAASLVGDQDIDFRSWCEEQDRLRGAVRN